MVVARSCKRQRLSAQALVVSRSYDLLG